MDEGILTITSCRGRLQAAVWWNTQPAPLVGTPLHGQAPGSAGALQQTHLTLLGTARHALALSSPATRDVTSHMEAQNSLIVSSTARLEWTETSAHCYIQITFPLPMSLVPPWWKWHLLLL